jgi:hypothetical protein
MGHAPPPAPRDPRKGGIDGGSVPAFPMPILFGASMGVGVAAFMTLAPVVAVSILSLLALAWSYAGAAKVWPEREAEGCTCPRVETPHGAFLDHAKGCPVGDAEDARIASLELWHETYNDAVMMEADPPEACRLADAKVGMQPAVKTVKEGLAEAEAARPQGEVVRSKTVFDPTVPEQMLGLPDGMRVNRDWRVKDPMLIIRDERTAKYMAVPLESKVERTRENVRNAVSHLMQLRFEQESGGIGGGRYLH